MLKITALWSMRPKTGINLAPFVDTIMILLIFSWSRIYNVVTGVDVSKPKAQSATDRGSKGGHDRHYAGRDGAYLRKQVSARAAPEQSWNRETAKMPDCCRCSSFADKDAGHRQGRAGDGQMRLAGAARFSWPLKKIRPHCTP